MVELTLVGVPAIFIPLPSAAEDHQTVNAKALSSKGAALIVSDNEAQEKSVPTLIQVIADPAHMQTLGDNIKQFAKPNVIDLIYKEIMKLV